MSLSKPLDVDQDGDVKMECTDLVTNSSSVTSVLGKRSAAPDADADTDSKAVKPFRPFPGDMTQVWGSGAVRVAMVIHRTCLNPYCGRLVSSRSEMAPLEHKCYLDDKSLYDQDIVHRCRRSATDPIRFVRIYPEIVIPTVVRAGIYNAFLRANFVTDNGLEVFSNVRAFVVADISNWFGRFPLELCDLVSSFIPEVAMLDGKILAITERPGAPQSHKTEGACCEIGPPDFAEASFRFDMDRGRLWPKSLLTHVLSAQYHTTTCSVLAHRLVTV